MTQNEVQLLENFFRGNYPYSTKGSVNSCINFIEAGSRVAHFSIPQWLCRAYITLHSDTPKSHNKEKFALLVNANFLRRSK